MRMLPVWWRASRSSTVRPLPALLYPELPSWLMRNLRLKGGSIANDGGCAEIKTEDDLRAPGAKPGTVPTDLEQSTGLERLEILGKMQGIDIFDMRPLDSSRVGTTLPLPLPAHELSRKWRLINFRHPPGPHRRQLRR